MENHVPIDAYPSPTQSQASQVSKLPALWLRMYLTPFRGLQKSSIQRIIRDETDAAAELDKVAARNEFDINRLNAEWEEPNTPLSPRISMENLERPLRDPELMPEGWSANWVGGKHWEITDPTGTTRRVTTDHEAYQDADGRLHWWQGPLHR